MPFRAHPTYRLHEICWKSNIVKMVPHLHKFVSEFEGRVLESHVLPWWTAEDETEIDVYNMSFRIQQDVAIMSETRTKYSSILWGRMTITDLSLTDIGYKKSVYNGYWIQRICL